MTGVVVVGRWREAGLAAGALAAVGTASAGGLGLGPLLAAPVGAAVAVLGVLAGEVAGAPPAGPVRTAGLGTRRVRDCLPPRLGVAVAAAAALLVALLVTTAATGSPDDLGRAGRALVVRCSASSGAAAGPWVGSWYGGPLAVVLLAGAGAAAVTLDRVVRRARPGDPAAGRADDARRSAAGRTVVGACGVLVTVPLVAASVVTAGAVLTVCAPAAARTAAWCLLAAVPAELALFAVSLAAAVSAGGRPRPVRVAPGTRSARW